MVPTSEQDSVSPSVSLSHQEASISLLSLSIRGQTEWNPQSPKTNQTDHVDHSLVSFNETMSHAKTDRSWQRVLTKCGPLEKGMANHFRILVLRTPWTVWKGKKMTLKDEFSRLLSAPYATGEEWRNKSRKNEEAEPKWKQCPTVDVTGNRS